MAARGTESSSARGGRRIGAAPPPPIEVRVEVRPPSPFRLPRRGGLDGLLRVRGGVLHRLLRREERPVLVRVAQIAPGRVLFGAAGATPEECHWAIARMRLALGIDQDLSEFHARFRRDPLIGRAINADPGLRVRGCPEPFEALAWAICEQLIEYERAAAIQRRLAARLGHRCPLTGLRTSPPAATVAAQAPARLESFGLSASRAIALRRAAAEVATGRVQLEDSAPEAGWRRLRRIPGIGSWTLQKLALEGQGRIDQIPAGDLAYVKLVGRLLSGSPYARASEAEVEAYFERFGRWRGLAGAYALRAAGGVSSLAAA